MTYETIIGTPADIKGDFVVASAVADATTLLTAVPVGNVGLIIEDSVDLRTLNIDTLVERLRDAFREQVTKLS